MKTAYFECSAGISGDMCLGALVDAGASLFAMKRSLKKIPIAGYILSSRKVIRAGISATKVDVHIKESALGAYRKTPLHEVQARRWKDIQYIIKRSVLPEKIKDKGLSVFKNLFEAESKVHGEPFDSVHLHELGATDCIVDIFGTLISLDLLGIEKMITSPVNLGQGTVHTDHGVLTIPAPATIELLRGYPVYSSEIPFELTTPTGAVILKTLTSSCMSFPRLAVEKIGYGAGNRDITTMPNVLKLMIGEEYTVSDKPISPASENSVIILETNIDDMNPQHFESVMNRLFAAGALDVFLENIIMKKSRPAIKITAIVRENDADKMADILFKETTTIGIRMYRADRKILEREVKRIKTRYGFVRFKVSRLKGIIVTATPEYEDIKAISEKTNTPIKIIAGELARFKPR
jgi:uncharacterized protein (TIGR00299 family) protein